AVPGQSSRLLPCGIEKRIDRTTCLGISVRRAQALQRMVSVMIAVTLRAVESRSAADLTAGPRLRGMAFHADIDAGDEDIVGHERLTDGNSGLAILLNAVVMACAAIDPAVSGMAEASVLEPDLRHVGWSDVVQFFQNHDGRVCFRQVHGGHIVMALA